MPPPAADGAEALLEHLVEDEGGGLRPGTDLQAATGAWLDEADDVLGDMLAEIVALASTVRDNGCPAFADVVLDETRAWLVRNGHPSSLMNTAIAAAASSAPDPAATTDTDAAARRRAGAALLGTDPRGRSPARPAASGAGGIKGGPAARFAVGGQMESNSPGRPAPKARRGLGALKGNKAGGSGEDQQG